MPDPNPIFDLLAAAKAAKRQSEATAALQRRNERNRSVVERSLAADVAAADQRIRRIFADPENWTFHRHIALVHQETDTLIGNFAEWRHNTAADARKLVRVEQPARADVVEYVSGHHWLPGADLAAPEAAPDPVANWECITDLYIPECDAYAPAVMVDVETRGARTSAIRLFDRTRFFNRQRTFHLELAEGTDVLGCLSMDCRNELAREVQRLRDQLASEELPE